MRAPELLLLRWPRGRGWRSPPALPCGHGGGHPGSGSPRPGQCRESPWWWAGRKDTDLEMKQACPILLKKRLLGAARHVPLASSQDASEMWSLTALLRRGTRETVAR